MTDDQDVIYAEVPLAEILSDGQTVRDIQDDDHVIELASSIAAHGLLEPIVLRFIETGKYQLLAGAHRLAAFHRLRLPRIPATIHKDDGTPIKALALIENIIRRDMSLAEEVNAVCFLHHDEGKSPSQISELLGKSKQWIMVRLSIPSMPEEVAYELYEGRLSLKHAEAISQVSETGLRKLLINNVIQQRLNSRQTEELAALYSENPSMESAIQAGHEKAQEVQTAAPAQRRCDFCGSLRLLQHIQFVGVCYDGCDTHAASLKVEEDIKCQSPD